LKTSDFRILTRRQAVPRPTRYAETIYRAALPLLEAELGHRRYRLIGVGLTELSNHDAAPRDLFEPETAVAERVERAIDQVRAKFGRDSIGRGRGLRPGPSRR